MLHRNNALLCLITIGMKNYFGETMLGVFIMNMSYNLLISAPLVQCFIDDSF